MPKLPVAGIELYYERRGAGEPLLLVQGLGAHSGHWGERFLGELERDFELIAFDQRGAGRSGVGADFTTADLASEALGLLDGLEIERAHVLGFSMGGMVAQELALSASKRLRTLTLGGTSPGGTQSKPTSSEVVQELTAAVLSADRERMLRTGFEIVVSAPFAAEPDNFTEFGEVARVYPADINLLMSQQAAVDGHDAYGRLRAIDVPTLVIHGTADRMLDVINGQEIASLIPDARLELMEDVGHLFFWEQPERTAQLIREHAGGASRVAA